jgi:hypothetical protein
MGTQASKGKQGIYTEMKGRYGSQISYPEKVKLWRSQRVRARQRGREYNELKAKSGAGTSGK